MESCKLPCDAPAQQFSVPQAHAAMQIHRECTTASCARKADAYWTLVDAGKIKTGKAVTR